MTEERKAEIVEAIVKKFEVTGLRPARGNYRQTIGDVKCACAIGVFGYGAGRFSAFCREVLVPEDDVSIAGIECGFDGEPLVDDPSDAQRNGLAIGAAVWSRVAHMTVR